MFTKQELTPQVVGVEALEGHRLRVRFADGVEGIVPMEKRLFGPVFEPLRDWEVFRQVRVDEFGAPCWPNGADLAPDALYEQLRNG